MGTKKIKSKELKEMLKISSSTLYRIKQELKEISK